jgi:transposase
MLTPVQMRRIEPYFPLSHGVPRVDDRRVLSGILYVIRNGLRWRDAPVGYGPHKTIYNRFIRWSRLGVFNRILAELAARGGGTDKLMTMPRTSRRTAPPPACSKRGSTPMYRAYQGRPDQQAPGGL